MAAIAQKTDGLRLLHRENDLTKKVEIFPGTKSSNRFKIEKKNLIVYFVGFTVCVGKLEYCGRTFFSTLVRRNI